MIGIALQSMVVLFSFGGSYATQRTFNHIESLTGQ